MGKRRKNERTLKKTGGCTPIGSDMSPKHVAREYGLPTWTVRQIAKDAGMPIRLIPVDPRISLVRDYVPTISMEDRKKFFECYRNALRNIDDMITSIKEQSKPQEEPTRIEER